MPTLKAVLHGLPLNATPEQLDALGREALSERAAANNLIVVGDPEVLIDEKCVRVTEGNLEGWKPMSHVGPGLRPQGRTVQWKAEVAVNPEAVPIFGDRDDDGSVMFNVPHLIEQRGGNVRAVHRLGSLVGVAEVTVSTFRRDGTGIGTLPATVIDRDEVEVPVFPGTALVRVAPDPTPADV